MVMLRTGLEYGCEACNTNKCQDKGLECIQLCAGKCVLGYSLTTCDEPRGGFTILGRGSQH